MTFLSPKTYFMQPSNIVKVSFKLISFPGTLQTQHRSSERLIQTSFKGRQQEIIGIEEQCILVSILIMLGFTYNTFNQESLNWPILQCLSDTSSLDLSISNRWLTLSSCLWSPSLIGTYPYIYCKKILQTKGTKFQLDDEPLFQQELFSNEFLSNIPIQNSDVSRVILWWPNIGIIIACR